MSAEQNSDYNEIIPIKYLEFNKIINSRAMQTITKQYKEKLNTKIASTVAVHLRIE